MLSKRYGIIALAVLGLGGLGYYAYNANRAPQGPVAPGGKPGAGGPPPGAMAVSVEMAKVEAVSFTDEATAVGTVKSNESVILRGEVAGRIAGIQFKDGKAVPKGALLLSLDASVQAAELQQAQANLALARSTHQRNQDLFARKFISQQALDSSAATLKVQEAAVALAQAKVAKTRIVAPFAGVVGIRNVSLGDYVKEGQDLVNIEDISTLKVDFRLAESFLQRVKPGQMVEVATDSLPGEVFKATVDAVDPMVDANGRAVSVRARLANPAGKLRPGLFARVRVVFGERKDVLMVPEQALMPGNPPSIFQVVEAKAKLAKVKIGQRRAGQVEIVEGLSAGDVVVTAGQLKLRPDAPIRMPTQEGMAGMGGMGGMSGMSGMEGMTGGKPNPAPQKGMQGEAMGGMSGMSGMAPATAKAGDGK